jgi:hypothetical protein
MAGGLSEAGAAAAAVVITLSCPISLTRCAKAPSRARW